MREDRHQTSEIEGFLPGLRRYARALVGHDAVDPIECADEMVVEAIERASLSQRVVWAGNARIWLFATLTSLNRSRLRNAAQAAARPASKSAAAPSGRGPGIAEAVNRLPLACREVLLLVVVEGFTYSEAGDIVGQPRLGIANRLIRAREMLADSLEAPPAREPSPTGRPVPHLRLVK